MIFDNKGMEGNIIFRNRHIKELIIDQCTIDKIIINGVRCSSIDIRDSLSDTFNTSTFVVGDMMEKHKL